MITTTPWRHKCIVLGALRPKISGYYNVLWNKYWYNHVGLTDLFSKGKWTKPSYSVFLLVIIVSFTMVLLSSTANAHHHSLAEVVDISRFLCPSVFLIKTSKLKKGIFNSFKFDKLSIATKSKYQLIQW